MSAITAPPAPAIIGSSYCRLTFYAAEVDDVGLARYSHRRSPIRCPGKNFYTPPAAFPLTLVVFIEDV